MVVAVLVGCQAGEEAGVVAQRQKYLLDSEPNGAMTVIDVRAQVDGAEGEPAEQPVVLVGRVGAGANQTWDPGKAVFVISDPSLPEDAHHAEDGHDHENCPFCQQQKDEAMKATALVRVLDATGEIVPIDARKLFPIQDGQLVVVRGKASVDTLGNLVVAADGIYLR